MTTIACGFTANIDLMSRLNQEFYQEIKKNTGCAPNSVIHTWEEFCTVVDLNVQKGSGAEYIVANLDILKRLEKMLKWKKSIGGTGLQAGCAANCAGYRALVNIPILSKELETVVSKREGLALLSDKEGEVPKHYILEYDVGYSTNRIIFRKSDEFSSDLIASRFLEEISRNRVGWLLISGFNAFDRSEEIDLFLRDTIKILETLGREKPKVHLELASIWSLDEQWKIIHTLGRYVDSIGLNEDEFQELMGLEESLLSCKDSDLLKIMEGACQNFGVAHFILHTMHFSLIQSNQYDTTFWNSSLENGNKFAFARAVKGEICDLELIHQLSSNSIFHPRGEKLRELTKDRKDITIVPAYTGETTSAIGLGDTFTAGLLVEAPVEFLPLRKIPSV